MPSLPNPAESPSELEQLREALAKHQQREALIQQFFTLDAYNLGQSFFEKTVESLAKTLGADYAFIGELRDPNTIETIALFAKGSIIPNFTYGLAGTPCYNVIHRGACLYPKGVADLFPDDKLLTEMRVESYIGVPLHNSEHQPHGIMVLMKCQPCEDLPLAESFLLMYAGRASAEIEHLEYRKRLQAQNQQLQENHRELYLAKRKAEQSDELKSSFLANMSHEIRTPMNAILGFATLLDSTRLDEQQRSECLVHMRRRGADLLKLIEDIIDLAKIESGVIDTVTETIELPAFLEDIHLQNTCLLTQSSRKILPSLKLEPLDDLRIARLVSADKVRLAQCLNNLLQNAIKFTEEGSIALSCRLEGAHLRFTVADTGIGVRHQDSEIIFQRFMQADNSTTRRHGGAGLGLAITKRLVQNMGGQIAVKTIDQTGGGAEFSFTIPYLPQRQTGGSAARTTIPRAGSPLDGLLLLVVEDDPHSQLFMNALLKNDGAVVICVDNIAAAIAHCRDNDRINAVLMDIHLPDANGLEGTRAIKALRPELPVIVQSASVFATDRKNAQDAGADAFLPKPIIHSDLLSCLISLVA